MASLEELNNLLQQLQIKVIENQQDILVVENNLSTTQQELAQTNQQLQEIKQELQETKQELITTKERLKSIGKNISLVLDKSHTGTDLGRQLEPLVKEYQTVNVSFKLEETENLSFTWNHPIVIPPNHNLNIWAPHTNNPSEESLRVTINMTQTPSLSTFVHPNAPGSRRIPHRVVLRESATLTLVGIRLIESANDSKELAVDAGEGGALFNIANDFGTIDINQSHIRSTEDIVGIGSRAYGRVKFGWTTVKRLFPDSRNIHLVKIYYGWGFAGAGGVVSRSHTNLDNGVSFQSHPGLIYLD